VLSAIRKSEFQGRQSANQSPSLSPVVEKTNESYQKQQIDSVSDPQFSKKDGDEKHNKGGVAGSDNTRVLFFKKNKNFAYQNIPISPNYHMVVEEDEGLHPKISILPSKIPDPEAPPGSCMISPPHIKQGALALFRSSLDRTALH
jgi:hypothetical protein